MTYIPHAICLLYDWTLIVLLIVGNAVVAVSYFAIPIGLLKQSRRLDGLMLPFSRRILLLFGGFIFACGMTHVMQLVVLFVPWYWADMCVVMITAILSIITAFLFVPKVWQLYSTPPISDLIEARASIEKARNARLLQAQHDAVESENDVYSAEALLDALERIDHLVKRLSR